MLLYLQTGNEEMPLYLQTGNEEMLLYLQAGDAFIPTDLHINDVRNTPVLVPTRAR